MATAQHIVLLIDAGFILWVIVFWLRNEYRYGRKLASLPAVGAGQQCEPHQHGNVVVCRTCGSSWDSDERDLPRCPGALAPIALTDQHVVKLERAIRAEGYEILTDPANGDVVLKLNQRFAVATCASSFPIFAAPSTEK